ncbi:MAG: FAD-dependent oxidoreductase [Candidatus Wallbacteria bacterium]
MKIIIIGGVAGGASAAARLRRLDETAEITMYERGEYISFANCGLPYHIGGVITDKASLLVQTVENMTARFNMGIKTMHEVIDIDAPARTIDVKNLVTGEIFKDNYDFLILSPGASPVKPPIPGLDGPDVFTLRNIPDMEKIIASVNNKAKTAVVIGGGFIGVETAENLIEKGLEVTLVEMQDQVLKFLDPDIAAFAHIEMKSRGINLILSDRVSEIKRQSGRKSSLILGSGREIEADMIILAIGVIPETGLAKKAGLKIGPSGAIQVDSAMRTSDEFIYAVGDACETVNFVTGEKTKIPLAGPANRQARIAANNICGLKSEYKNTQGTSIVKVFDMACASTGANSELLTKLKIPFKTVTIHSGSHAGYYPGAYIIHLKLIFAPADGKILGAQAAGYDGVDKRIDVLAAAIRHGAAIYDLEDYELSYAPPYGSAKDPVNVAGFVAVNANSGFAPVIDIFELDSYLKKGALLLDVRNDAEITGGKIADAIHIPLHSLRKSLAELPKDKIIVTYCKVGLRGYIAQRILMQNGFNAVNLTGGYESYNAFFNQNKYGAVPKLNKSADDTQTKTDNPSSASVIKVNACGLQCPGPLLKLKEALNHAADNDIIEIESSDQSFYNDVQAFAGSTGNKIIGIEKGKVIKAKILKCPAGYLNSASTQNLPSKSDQATLVVFSDDFDKAMATCIIANGALAMGKKVSLFFTFWGINILRKTHPVRTEKTFIEKMFGIMMPRGVSSLTLSKMNMLGMGTQMIKGLMKKYNVEPLDKLLKSIVDNGGKLVVCKMSMELMGIKKEELIDGVIEGGVASYLSDAEKGNINLFI